MATNVASGRAIATDTNATIVASGATSPSWLGNTSSPSVKNIATWATQASPSWNANTVRRAGISRLPSTSPAR